MTVSRVSSVAVLAATATMPTHTAGDMILAYAYSASVAAPAPALPAGWVSLDEQGSGTNSARVGYKIAATGTEPVGTWTGAAGLIVIVLRTTGRWKPPLLASAGNQVASDVIEFPDLPARAGGGWVVRFAGHTTATDMQAVLPDGWTATAGQNTRVRSMDTGASVGAAANDVGANTQAVNTIGFWRSATVSVADADQPAAGTGARDVWDKVFATGTVLTLSGLSFNMYDDMPAALQGIFAQAPYTTKRVVYPANLDTDSISKGVTALDATLAATAGNVIVLAHDQGAQVCAHWMAQYAADATRMGWVSRLVFVLLGNPLRANGGGALVGGREIGGTIGTPTPTGTVWPIVDVARRYDGWADQPIDTTNVCAVNNALAGRKTVHTAYRAVDLYDPSHTINTDGNTTYVLTAETALPLLEGKTVDTDPDVTATVVAVLRKWIETAYPNRPTGDPTVAMPKIDNWRWRAVLTQMGVDLTLLEAP